MLSENVRNAIDAWLKKFPEDQRRSATLYALRMAQEDNGWLTEPLMDAVAEYLGLAPIEVYEVANFYSMYDLSPRGRHKISVCTSISCMLCSCDTIVDHIKNRYQVGFNETTADGKFTLKSTECLAACVGAPALLVDDKVYHEKLTPEKVDAIIEALE